MDSLKEIKPGRFQKGFHTVLVVIAANAVLGGMKIVGGIVGHSQALIADGIESLGDLFVSGLVLHGFHRASVPPDRNHPYGHGKSESLVAFLVGIILILAAIGVIGTGIWGLLKPRQVPKPYTLGILITVVVVKETLYRYLHRRSQSLRSIALHSEGWHQRSDAITSAAAAVGISVALIGGQAWSFADEVAAFFAAGIILWNASRVIRRAISELMDAAVDPALLDRITQIAAETPEVVRVEKCIARRAGPELFVDMHIEVKPTLTVQHAHEIAHRVKDRIRHQLPYVRDVLIHIEPARENNF